MTPDTLSPEELARIRGAERQEPRYRHSDIEFAHALVHAGHMVGDITPGLRWKRGIGRDSVARILADLRFRLDARLDSSGDVRWVAVPS